MRANTATTIIMILVSLPATGCATAGVYTTHRNDLSGSVLASIARYPSVVAYDDGAFGIGGNSNVLVSTGAQVSYSRGCST